VNLHAAKIQAAAEAYIGLVETGVGLIPGGGGTKEMLIARTNTQVGQASARPLSGIRPRSFHALKPIFEAIAMAKVGTSAENAASWIFAPRRWRFHEPDRLVADAKEAALALVRGGYKPLAASWQEGAQTRRSKCSANSFLPARSSPST